MKILFALITIITTTEIVTLQTHSASALAAHPGTVGVLRQSASSGVGDGTATGTGVGGSIGVGNVIGSAANGGGQVASVTGGSQGADLGVGISGEVSKNAGSVGVSVGNVVGLAAGRPIGQGAGGTRGQNADGVLGGGTSAGGTESRHANSGEVLNPSIGGTQSAVSNGRLGTNGGGMGQRASDGGGLGTSYGGVSRGASNSTGQGIGDGMGEGTSCWATESTGSCGGLNKNGSAVGTSGDVLQNTRGGSFLGMVGGGGLLRRVKRPPPPPVVPAKRPQKSCPTSGFSYSANAYLGSNGCICNFAGACDMKTNMPTAAALSNPKTLNGFAPTDVENVALDGLTVGTICESDTVAILYDCFARVPLYSATVINGSRAGGKAVFVYANELRTFLTKIFVSLKSWTTLPGRRCRRNFNIRKNAVYFPIYVFFFSFL